MPNSMACSIAWFVGKWNSDTKDRLFKDHQLGVFQVDKSCYPYFTIDLAPGFATCRLTIQCNASSILLNLPYPS
jgi:hypothetical protein